MKLKKQLRFIALREALSACFNRIPDIRQVGKVDYTIHDALMSGFACMYFQDPSLLQFQKRLEKKHHTNNVKTLFGVKAIPEATQLRAIIDGVDSHYLGSFFDDYFHRLQRGKYLEQYQLLPSLYLCPMDATQYFSSGSVSCEGCLRAKPITKKGYSGEENLCEEKDADIRYSHKVLQLAIMHPDMKQVIPLMPEEIRNGDGGTKQDCEINAAKRLLPKLRKAHPQLGLIMGGDDIYSRQPIISTVLAARMHYIFVAKPDSHKYLMEWLAAYPLLHELQFVDVKGVRFELTDKLYQTCRQYYGSKKNLWDHLRSYLKLLIFDSWEFLLSFTLNPEHYIPDKLPAPS